MGKLACNISIEIMLGWCQTKQQDGPTLTCKVVQVLGASQGDLNHDQANQASQGQEGLE